MVWLHGGAFSGGSSIEQVAYEGENLCKHGQIVFVSINHRLNAVSYTHLYVYKRQGGACLRMLNTVLHKGKQRHRNAVHARTFAAQLEFQVDFVSQAVAELHIVLYRFQLIPNRDKGFCIRKSMRDVLGKRVNQQLRFIVFLEVY